MQRASHKNAKYPRDDPPFEGDLRPLSQERHLPAIRSSMIRRACQGRAVLRRNAGGFYGLRAQ
jgi:hypothetical protein